MKIKHLLILLTLAFTTTIVGAFFKILHWEYGKEILFSGILAELFIGVVLIIKLLTSKKTKNFLNW